MAVDHSGLETLSLSITVSVSRPIRDWEGESEARYVATYRLTAWLSACLSLPILTIVSVKATPWRRDEHEESCRSMKQSLGAGGSAIACVAVLYANRALAFAVRSVARAEISFEILSMISRSLAARTERSQKPMIRRQQRRT